MITVGMVKRERKERSVILSCEFESGGAIESLWFEVDDEYERFLEDDCGDSFFVILSLYAFLHNQDVRFESAVSTRLYHGVIGTLLPALRIVFPGSRLIDVHAETRNFEFSAAAHGTALSLGVDSFHALASNVGGPYPVTHVALFNSGAFGELGGAPSRKRFQNTAESVAFVAEEMGLPLVLVDSNMSEVLGVSFLLTHSIRNLSCALLLPHLFGRFSYASGYPVEQFQLRRAVGIAHYDLLISKALSTESLEVVISGLHDKRMDKILTIASFAPAVNHLNVCLLIEENPFLGGDTHGTQNCSRCYKCVKTLAAMDALGLLEDFSNVFSLDIYRRERSSNLGDLFYAAKRMKDQHAVELFEVGKLRAGFMPFSAYLFACRRAVRAVMGKFKLTALVLGGAN